MKWCSHTAQNGVIHEHFGGPCPSDEELEQWAQWFVGIIEYRRRHPKKSGEERYEFWKHYQGEAHE